MRKHVIEERTRMAWLIRFLLLARARRLFRECAACTFDEYGAGAAAKLRSEIDPGTPFSGRLLIWLMIAEVRRLAWRDRHVSTKDVALAPLSVTLH